MIILVILWLKKKKVLCSLLVTKHNPNSVIKMSSFVTIKTPPLENGTILVVNMVAVENSDYL